MNTQINVSDKRNIALSSIYTAYYKKLYAYGVTIGFCEHVCKDAIQDVFCTICNSKKNLECIDSIEPYLLRCMKNNLFDIYKNQKKLNCINYNNNIIDTDLDSINKIISVENQISIKQEVERLLNDLKPRQRKIIYCRFYHNLKFDEIAVLMDMSADAVKKMLYRSLKQLEQETTVTSNWS